MHNCHWLDRINLKKQKILDLHWLLRYHHNHPNQHLDCHVLDLEKKKRKLKIDFEGLQYPRQSVVINLYPHLQAGHFHTVLCRL